METGSLSPGRSMTVDYDLPGGQYVVLCFFPDPKMGGMPHAMMGMVGSFTVAKSLAGGLPISAVVGRAHIMDAPLPGGLGGTYGGNALACAAALAVIEAYEQEQLLERGQVLGERLRQGLLRLQARHPRIGDVRGTGFMLAIELIKDDEARSPDAELTQQLIDQARIGGLLVIKCGVYRNVLRFLAPLVTEESQIDEALVILEAALLRVLD